MRTERAYSLLELVVTMASFLLLSLVLVACLSDVSKLWRRADARDEAARQLLKAKSMLTRDLANSCHGPQQYARATLPPATGSSGSQGDALTFLSVDSSTQSNALNTTSTGQGIPAVQITYFLAIPNAKNSFGIQCAPGAPDANGYEQQNPFKWLIRRVDPAPSGSPPAIDPGWVNDWATAPTSADMSATVEIVAEQLLGFRVLQSGGEWTIELSAVSVSEATHTSNVGNTALAKSRFTAVEQLTVLSHN